ncbi:hypothetical protein IEQ34_026993 [Dendrobium chrysotoxum]|uniref:Uncharacterized protein n=1 Tax=Dendrobium chrysotoxum TaxID=161865 RepID=A0AAV7FIC8_DENCH|nr:hypothetical protein IEQ34_026993 [Dendrobium chrysotoxum]
MMKGAAKMNGKEKYRSGKRRRSSQKQEDAPKETTVKDLLPSSPSKNPKRRKKCKYAPDQNRPSLLEKLRLRLSGGHFRMLNEKLYTCRANVRPVQPVHIGPAQAEPRRTSASLSRDPRDPSPSQHPLGKILKGV